MLILFDIDGTLLDDAASERAGAAALYAVAAESDSLEEFTRAWSAASQRHYARYLAGETDFQGQRRARVREIVDDSLTDAAADRLFEVYLAAYESAWTLYPDALGCLDALTCHRLGVVSNGHGAQQRRKLERLGIADRFEGVLISSEAGCRKPAAGIFLKACALLGTRPEDALYVGDRYEIDALGARAAGLAGVWLDRDGSRTAAHEPPIISSLGELLGHVGRPGTRSVRL